MYIYNYFQYPTIHKLVNIRLLFSLIYELKKLIPFLSSLLDKVVYMRIFMR